KNREEPPLYPPPPCGCERGATLAPAGETANQEPPNALIPSPFVSPGFLSFTKVYSGCPLYVSWLIPSGRAVVPTSDGLAPLPTSGVPRTRSGGQLTAQAPVQALIVPVSRSKRYSVRPCRSTRTSPSPVLATPTL